MQYPLNRENDGRLREGRHRATFCAHYQDRAFRNLKCQRLRVDEMWSFCYCKQKNVTGEVATDRVAGDVWLWSAIDEETKLVPCWYVGQRDAIAASEFIADLESRLANRVQLTSDGFKLYLNAVIGHVRR